MLNYILIFWSVVLLEVQVSKHFPNECSIFNIHGTFILRPGHDMNVNCTLGLSRVPTEYKCLTVKSMTQSDGEQLFNI